MNVNNTWELWGFNETPYAITIKEPYVTCGLFYGKPVENRNWTLPSGIVGKRVFLHTSKQPDNDGMWSASKLAGVDLSKVELLPPGCIVATAVFAGQVSSHDSPWFFGKYGFVWESLQPLPDFYPCRGQLKFWQVPGDLLETIKGDAMTRWSKQE